MQKITKDAKTGRIKVQTVNTEPSLTQQQFKDETDINKIMKRFEAQGITYNGLPQQDGVFADLTVIPQDYQESLQKLLQAEEAFMALDPEIRSNFGNNPQKLVEFVSDSKNKDKAVALGLIKQEEPPAAPPAAPAAETPKTP